ncbi:Ubiquitin carboxyl-terminal hydrolase isozyme L3 [Geodia barretti]|nr:Ubiquitin carboxyl-terminal hydrolase isozyme L3 [Geodia barretti]
MNMSYQFHDVFGLDDELLGLVPQPCVAILLLFPINQKLKKYEEQETERIHKEGQICSDEVFFIKQTIGNACGTIGMLHALGNCQEQLTFDWFLKSFFEKTKNMNSKERGRYLEENEDLSDAHEASALEGDTAPPAPEETVNLHFIAIVHRKGHLYELDGRKPFPINHGSTSGDTFLMDAARVCREFMTRDPSEVHFTIVALCKV